ncbi:MAG: hypothetical protein HYY35_01865 [Deltaproteobacteria bacterium]|nr:hypothetical protein [Deltaproteobacteria bacterium]
MARLSRIGAVLAAAAWIGACASLHRAGPAGALRRPPAPRLSLDPEISPVPFRWLADDAVLVAPGIGARKLASFGNYVSRAAQKLPHVRLSVWDDEAAWQAAGARADEEEAPAHRRAEYRKEVSALEPADRYLVFSAKGEVVYQRDFRSWPLSDLD